MLPVVCVIIARTVELPVQKFLAAQREVCMQ